MKLECHNNELNLVFLCQPLVARVSCTTICHRSKWESRVGRSEEESRGRYEQLQAAAASWQVWISRSTTCVGYKLLLLHLPPKPPTVSLVTLKCAKRNSGKCSLASPGRYITEPAEWPIVGRRSRQKRTKNEIKRKWDIHWAWFYYWREMCVEDCGTKFYRSLHVCAPISQELC